MKCPFRKIIKHEEKYCNMPAKDIEEYPECYEKECPYYILFRAEDGEVYEICDRTRKAVKE